MSIRLAVVAPISPDAVSGRRFYEEAVGLEVIEADERGDLWFSDAAIGGFTRLGLWSLSSASAAIFDTPDWPADLPRPQVSLEFLADTPDELERASQSLVADGGTLVTPLREEPGETVIRVLSPEGALVSLSLRR